MSEEKKQPFWAVPMIIVSIVLGAGAILGLIMAILEVRNMVTVTSREMCFQPVEVIKLKPEEVRTVKKPVRGKVQRQCCWEDMPSPMPKELQWWEKKDTITYAASIFRRRGNRNKMIELLQKWNKIPDEKNDWEDVLWELDKMLKQMVYDIGGPLVDRNFNRSCVTVNVED